jgi:predicted DNA-binding transcriptional regulator
MNDVDMTQKEAAETIERVDAALRAAQAALDSTKEILGEEATQPGFARNYVARQPQKLQEEFEAAVAETVAEIERDLPKRTATRQVRVKPTRQMV